MHRDEDKNKGRNENGIDKEDIVHFYGFFDGGSGKN